MIDLSSRKVKLYQIKDSEGTILKIKLPTQKLLLKMLDLQNVDVTDLAVFDEIFSILLEIFNKNTNGKVYTQDDLEDCMDIQLAMTVLQDYLEFSYGQTKN